MTAAWDPLIAADQRGLEPIFMDGDGDTSAVLFAVLFHEHGSGTLG